MIISDVEKIFNTTHIIELIKVIKIGTEKDMYIYIYTLVSEKFVCVYMYMRLYVCVCVYLHRAGGRARAQWPASCLMENTRILPLMQE